MDGLPCCDLDRMLLEVTIGHLAQIQDRFVALPIAIGAAPPFVVPNSLKGC